LENRKRFLPLHSRNEGKKKGGDAERLGRESQSDFGGKTREGANES